MTAARSKSGWVDQNGRSIRSVPAVRGAARRQLAAWRAVSPMPDGVGARNRSRRRRRRTRCRDVWKSVRPVPADREDRRRRHGDRLARTPGTPDPPRRRAQGREAGRRLRSSAVAVRLRAAGPGDPQSPAHRHGVRRRSRRRRPAVLRDGVRGGAADHGVRRSARASDPRAARIIPAGLRSGRARPSEGRAPPRPEARQHPRQRP